MLDADLELRGDLGFDLIALAELAIAIEDAFGIAVDMTDLDACRTVRDLQELVAARSAYGKRALAYRCALTAIGCML